MREAWSQFYEAVNERALAHEGDSILTAHVLNAAAHVDPSGHWKVRKIKQSHKIDGLVASVIAYSRAAPLRPTGRSRSPGPRAGIPPEGRATSPWS
jgi:phage terminase large subunit-like protein